jgi:hypothetical protein
LSASEFLYNGHSQYGFDPVLPTLFMAPLFSGKYTASPHIDPEPLVAPRCMKGSEVLESIGVTALDGWGNFGLQHNSGRYQDAVNEDDLPTLEELEKLLRPTLRKKILIGEPKKP